MCIKTTQVYLTYPAAVDAIQALVDLRRDCCLIGSACIEVQDTLKRRKLELQPTIVTGIRVRKQLAWGYVRSLRASRVQYSCSSKFAGVRYNSALLLVLEDHCSVLVAVVASGNGSDPGIAPLTRLRVKTGPNFCLSPNRIRRAAH